MEFLPQEPGSQLPCLGWTRSAQHAPTSGTALPSYQRCNKSELTAWRCIPRAVLSLACDLLVTTTQRGTLHVSSIPSTGTERSRRVPHHPRQSRIDRFERSHQQDPGPPATSRHRQLCCDQLWSERFPYGWNDHRVWCTSGHLQSTPRQGHVK